MRARDILLRNVNERLLNTTHTWPNSGSGSRGGIATWMNKRNTFEYLPPAPWQRLQSKTVRTNYREYITFRRCLQFNLWKLHERNN